MSFGASAGPRADAWALVWVRFGVGVVVGACVCENAGVAVGTGVGASRRGSGFLARGRVCGA